VSTLVAAYHEAAHALVARALRQPVESVTVSPIGTGVLHTSPLPPDASDEEIARRLTIVLAGKEGERHAPRLTAEQNGADRWFTVAELEALVAEDDLQELPSDEDVLAHYSERIGAEAVEKARTLAAELVERAYVVGYLEKVADELLWRTTLTGDDLERLLAPA
jgi:ATP-dependent Zn protease